MGDDKPFGCSEPSCQMRFTNEDHLTVHKMKHAMSLVMTSADIKADTVLSFVADQTPTPTKFLRNCEEMGLFHDLTKNPFDDAFKKASESLSEQKSLYLHDHEGQRTGSPYLHENADSIDLHSHTLHTPTPHILRHPIKRKRSGQNSENVTMSSPNKTEQLEKLVSIPGQEAEIAYIESPNSTSVTCFLTSASQAVMDASHSPSLSSNAGQLHTKNTRTLTPVSQHSSSGLFKFIETNSSILNFTQSLNGLKSHGRHNIGDQEASSVDLGDSEVVELDLGDQEVGEIDLGEQEVLREEEQVVTDGEYEIVMNEAGCAADMFDMNCYNSMSPLNVARNLSEPVDNCISCSVELSTQEVASIGSTELPTPMTPIYIILSPANQVVNLHLGSSPAAQSLSQPNSSPLISNNTRLSSVRNAFRSSGFSAASTRTHGRTSYAPLAPRLFDTQRQRSQGISNATKQRLKESIQLNALQNILSSTTKSLVQQRILNNTNSRLTIAPADSASSTSSTVRKIAAVTSESSLMRLALTAGERESDQQTKRLVESRREKRDADASNSSGKTQSSLESSGDEEEKRSKFLARNRAAARRCRMKKKASMDDLIQTVQHYEHINDKLVLEKTELTREVVTLRNQLAAHQNCPVTRQQLLREVAVKEEMQCDDVTSSSYGATSQPVTSLFSKSLTVSFVPAATIRLVPTPTTISAYDEVLAMAALSTLAENSRTLTDVSTNSPSIGLSNDSLASIDDRDTTILS